jgi:hypothetical protein
MWCGVGFEADMQEVMSGVPMGRFPDWSGGLGIECGPIRGSFGRPSVPSCSAAACRAAA